MDGFVAGELANERLAEAQMHCQYRLGSQVRHLRLTPRDGGVSISGHCWTYYAKQLAQHVVCEETGFTIVANDIQVMNREW